MMDQVQSSKLSQYLTELRESKGLSMKEARELLDVSHISSIEKNTNTFSPFVLFKILDGYEVPPDEVAHIITDIEKTPIEQERFNLELQIRGFNENFEKVDAPLPLNALFYKSHVESGKSTADIARSARLSTSAVSNLQRQSKTGALPQVNTVFALADVYDMDPLALYEALGEMDYSPYQKKAIKNEFEWRGLTDEVFTQLKYERDLKAQQKQDELFHDDEFTETVPHQHEDAQHEVTPEQDERDVTPEHNEVELQPAEAEQTTIDDFINPPDTEEIVPDDDIISDDSVAPINEGLESDEGTNVEAFRSEVLVDDAPISSLTPDAEKDAEVADMTYNIDVSSVRVEMYPPNTSSLGTFYLFHDENAVEFIRQWEQILANDAHVEKKHFIKTWRNDDTELIYINAQDIQTVSMRR